jgi:hypothetical protein
MPNSNLIPVPIETIIECKLNIEVRPIPELKSLTDIEGLAFKRPKNNINR